MALHLFVRTLGLCRFSGM